MCKAASSSPLVKKEFDIEAAKERVVAKEAKRKHNNAKAQSFAIAADKMGIFDAEVRRRRKTGWCQRAWKDADALQDAIDEYMTFIYEIKIRPYKEGLCIWLDIAWETYYAILRAGDRRSEILQKFEISLGHFSAQAIASTEGNPSGDIYLDKSRLNYSDQPSEQTINLNIGATTRLDPQDLAKLVASTPIEVECREIE